MAQVLLSMEEYKQTEQKMSAIKGLQKFVKGSNVFEDNTACWNTEQDVIRPFSLEETKTLVKQILEL